MGIDSIVQIIEAREESVYRTFALFCTSPRILEATNVTGIRLSDQAYMQCVEHMH